MKTLLAIFLSISCLLSYHTTVTASEYDDAVSGWKSYQDVADWLENNFSFSKQRQRKIIKRLRADGPEGLLVRNPSSLFEDRSGFCGDSSNFAIKALNRINPSYNARWVFIWNDAGRPNHWVTAFDHDGKLYIMDYGTGNKWREMQGVHGPYNSLDDYRNFLASLNIENFEVGKVLFRDMPGKED